MAKKRKVKTTFRYYEMPQGMPLIALLGKYPDAMLGGNEPDSFHFHNNMEIGYCYAGNGYMAFTEEKLPYHGDMFTVIPKNFSHKTIFDKKGDERWEYLVVDLDKFLGDMYKSNIQLAEWIAIRANRKVHLAQAEEQREIAFLIKRIFQVMKEQKEFYQEEVKAFLLALLIQIARWNKEETDENDIVPIVSNSTVISPALNYISIAPEKPVKIGELAEMCHISETHFRRVFAECMKMSPVKYINYVRIRRSCEELKRTDAPISVVANRSGFPTLSTFNRNFREIMGVSPQQWRKKSEYYEHKLHGYGSRSENISVAPDTGIIVQ